MIQEIVFEKWFNKAKCTPGIARGKSADTVKFSGNVKLNCDEKKISGYNVYLGVEGGKEV